VKPDASRDSPRHFSNWLPQEERAHAEGWKAASARWGGRAALLLVVALYASLGWRVTFVLFGAIGFVWAALDIVALAERDKLNRAIEALQATIKRVGRPPKKPVPIETSAATQKRHVRAAARRKMAAAQKKRRAAIKAEK